MKPLDEIELEDIINEEEAFVPYDITSYPSDLTLQVLYDMWKAGDIYVPEFQRKFVWSIEQSSLLIDSFLMGLPVPPTFFYLEEETNKSLIIDGLQRIMSIVFFFDGFFGEEVHGKKTIFKLKGLDEKSPFSGKKFSELDENHQRKLKGAVLRAINIRQIRPAGEQTSKYHIFERLNTGGTPLTPQEIRNCVFHGPFSETLKELNNNKDWRKIIGKASLDRHQKDAELILRLFALYDNWQSYEKPMKEFLNVAMNQNREGTGLRVQKFSKAFSTTCAFIVKTLGDKPFHVRGPLNSSVMDSVFCIIAENKDSLVPDIKAAFNRLCADEAYKENTSHGTSDNAVVSQRLNIAKSYLVSTR